MATSAPPNNETEDEDLDEKGTMTFLQHLEELRGTLVRSMAAIVIGMMIMLPLTPAATKLLNWPVTRAGLDPSTFLINLETIGMLKVFLMIGFWGGMMLATPFILYYIGRFIFPGLHGHEKKAVRIGSFFGGILFFFGAALGFGVSLPFFLKINLRVGEWMGYDTHSILILDYFKTALKTILAFGLSFELPMLVFILGFLGVVNSVQLREKRKHVLVGILVMAMFLTPPDVVTQVILTVPLFLLYELTVWLVWIKERKDGTTDAGPPLDKKSMPVFLVLGVLAVAILGYTFLREPPAEGGPPPGVGNPSALFGGTGDSAIAKQLRTDLSQLQTDLKGLTERIETNQSKINGLSTESLPGIKTSVDKLMAQVEQLSEKIDSVPPPTPPPIPVPAPVPE